MTPETDPSTRRQGTPESEGFKGPSTPWWEDAAILLAIASFWPVLLGWPSMLWRYLLYAMGGLMIVIFFRRRRRLKNLRRIQEEPAGGSPGQENFFRGEG